MSHRQGKRASQRAFEQANGHLGWCGACGKATYLSKATAKRAIRQMKGREGRLNAYRCPGSGHWHLGHVPPALKDGKVARSELKLSTKRLRP